jgi:hypothetical protein
MLKLSTTVLNLIAIAIGTTLTSIYNLPLNAQNNQLEDNNFQENITPQKDLNWRFSSENESRSLQDNLQNLEEYSISELNSEADLKLTENTPKWGNRGDVEDRSFKIEVYDY